MTHPDDNTLALLVDGALDDAARADVERHLDACIACSELVSELAWVVTPQTREAPAGYRFVRELPGKVWETTSDELPSFELGFGTWPVSLIAVRDEHLATIYSIAADRAQSYIAYERSARTFREWCAEAPRSADEIISVWRRALRGLAALHAKGFVHARVSPEHLCVADDGRVFVGAYARELGKTSGYVAPEILGGEGASVASDQYGACVVLWEALAGSKPFAGATAGALAVAMTSPPSRPARSHPAFAILERGLAADPGQRWPSVDALAAAFDRPPRYALWLVITAIVAVFAYLLLR